MSTSSMQLGNLSRVALITGSGAGIGRGIAVAFARAGYDLALCDINSRELAETVRQVDSLGRSAYSETIDLREEKAIQGFVERAGNKCQRITTLINNAGVMHIHAVDALPIASIDEMLSVNLRAAILMTKHVVPHLRKAGGGVILHMGSVHAYNGHAGASVYGSTKAALLALARSQAVELAPYNIRVNSVSPGTVDSPMLHDFLARHSPDPAKAAAAFTALHPRGRLASIDEVARCFLFLASDDAANVTGTDLLCDGGYSIQGFQPKN